MVSWAPVTNLGQVTWWDTTKVSQVGPHGLCEVGQRNLIDTLIWVVGTLALAERGMPHYGCSSQRSRNLET